MSEIPFIKALGDALDTATTTTTADRERRSHRNPRLIRPRKRMALVLVGLVVGVAGAAAAVTLLGSSQRLADGTVNCFFGTRNNGSSYHGQGISPNTPNVGDVAANGQSPIALCRQAYAENAHTGLKAANVPFVACRQNATVVAVFVATGRSDQCQSLGDTPLPPAYPAAAARIRALERALTADQNQHYCATATVLGRQVRSTLANMGFVGWRTHLPARRFQPRLDPPEGTGGTCGQVLSGPPASSVQIDAPHKSVYISTGPPRPVGLLVNHLSYELNTHTYQQCFTATSVRALVRREFAATPLRPRFATTQPYPAGVRFEPRSQRLYDQGCVRTEFEIPSNNERYVDVWLWARDAPPLPAHYLYPPAGAFRP
jgi:hypothetical protein